MFFFDITRIYIVQPEAESFHGSSANKDHVIWPKARGNHKQAHCQVFIRSNLGILLAEQSKRTHSTGGSTGTTNAVEIYHKNT